jgi:hypothetical protein
MKKRWSSHSLVLRYAGKQEIAGGGGIPLAPLNAALVEIETSSSNCCSFGFSKSCNLVLVFMVLIVFTQVRLKVLTLDISREMAITLVRPGPKHLVVAALFLLLRSGRSHGICVRWLVSFLLVVEHIVTPYEAGPVFLSLAVLVILVLGLMKR